MFMNTNALHGFEEFKVGEDERCRVYEFGNRFGVSVINDGYGSQEGLFEIGFLHDGELCYFTGLTPDYDCVKGWLSDAEVAHHMVYVQALAEKPVCLHHKTYDD